MLTFFSTPKPFRGHINVIQRNAIQSWLRIHPGVEVILLGDDEGAAETCREFGIRHVPQVARNEHGTKYLASIYDRAQELSRHDLLCYVNCDIVLMSDFREAVRRVAERNKEFLMVGRRWDTNITAPWDFDSPDWEQRLRALALSEGKQRPPQWIDYFVFSRGLYCKKIPPFVIGRPGWDNWLVWYARASKARVVDASAVVVALHQNHDYSYHPEGEKGVWEGKEAQENHVYLDAGRRYCSIANATHRLTPSTVEKNLMHWSEVARRKSWGIITAVWFKVLDVTRPIRVRLGLSRDAQRRFLTYRD